MTLVLVSLVFASQLAWAGAAGQARSEDADAKLEQRLQAFAQQIRCLVCQNETLAESRADLAIDLRREIREQMEAGRSDREIIDFLTERFGDFVLYRPPVKPSTYLLWFGPFMFLSGGLFALYRGVSASSALPVVPPLSSAQRQRARQLLEAQRREGT